MIAQVGADKPRPAGDDCGEAVAARHHVDAPSYCFIGTFFAGPDKASIAATNSPALRVAVWLAKHRARPAAPSLARSPSGIDNAPMTASVVGAITISSSGLKIVASPGQGSLMIGVPQADASNSLTLGL
jgi:hypothetical protein